MPLSLSTYQENGVLRPICVYLPSRANISGESSPPSSRRVKATVRGQTIVDHVRL